MDLSQLEKELGVTFSDKNLLKQSCVHRSYLNENPSFPLEHNERLEFLGDAVLELVVTEYLYNTYPNPEGELTNWRAALVNAKMMAVVAKNLDPLTPRRREIGSRSLPPTQRPSPPAWALCVYLLTLVPWLFPYKGRVLNPPYFFGAHRGINGR